jgi:hypothetical protein
MLPGARQRAAAVVVTLIALARQTNHRDGIRQACCGN